MEKLKIFVSAYACEPYKGSEIGVGWNWILEMSKYFELWVMTRANNREVIEEYFEKNNLPCPIHFLYFDLPDSIKKFKKGMRGVRIYYNLWQIKSNRLVKETMEENDIPVYHLLTYGNALWKASSYGEKKFFVWGPTGGLDTIEREYSKHYSFRNRMVESVRRFVIRTLPLNFGFNSRCRHADLILCKARSTIRAIPKKYRHKAVQFTDVAADLKTVRYEKDFSDDRMIEYLVVGKLDAWRGYDLLLEALAEAIKTKQNLHLTVLGEGSEKQKIEEIRKKRSLEAFVSMPGQVSMEKYKEYLAHSDVIVNPCLKEGAVTVSFDAMAYAKPFICIDTGGYTNYFTDEYAIVLPRKGRKETIEDLSCALLKFSDGETRKRYSEKIAKVAERISWEQKGKDIREAIERAYAEQKEKDH